MRILTASRDGTARFHYVDSQDLIEFAKESRIRDYSAAELVHYGDLLGR